MKVHERTSLSALNTFGVDSRARLAVEIESEEDLLGLPALDPRRDLVLGGGSNVLLLDDVPGTVLLNRIRGKAVVEERNGQAWVEAGAGENWHTLVRWTLENGLYGLENLSLIPGLAGAAPMQNIGAYGVELSTVLDRVTAWDWQRGRWVVFEPDDCHLAYRDSRFKSEEPDRYLLTSIRLRLDRDFRPRLAYTDLREELAKAGLSKPTAMEVSEAVIRLRCRKLPDPAEIGNAGSFFKNPVVPIELAEELESRFPGLQWWRDVDDRAKLSAAWMIERSGCKGLRRGDAGVSVRHALVLVNHGSASGREILDLSRAVNERVTALFGVRLETEPKIVSFSRVA